MRPSICLLLSLVWLLGQSSIGCANTNLQRGLSPQTAQPDTLTATQSAQDQISSKKRVALVIGNSNYVSFPRLPTPKNDAEDVGTALKNLGFEVTISTDLTVLSLKEALSKFRAASQKSEIGIFFYAGNAIQYHHVNFLLPTDVDTKDPRYLQQTITIDDINLAMSEVYGPKIIIIDASRDNSSILSYTEKGLAGIKTRDDNVIMSSTRANSVTLDREGRNSLFSKVLVEQLKQPSHQDLWKFFSEVRLKVEENSEGKQVPELMLASIGDFSLDLNDGSEWRAVANKRDPKALREFATRFPDSAFRAQAESLAQQLERGEEQGQHDQMAVCSHVRGILDASVAVRDRNGLERLAQDDSCPALKSDIDQAIRSMNAPPQPIAAAQANDTIKQAASLDQAEARARQAEARAREAEVRMHEAEAQLQSAKGEALRIEAEAKVQEAEALSRQASAEALVKEAERKQKAFDLQTAQAVLPPIPNQGRRVALIIGNSAYRSVSMLPNPKSDATAIADALKAVGFTAVTLAEDLTLDQMRKALREFKIAADGADWAMVYYAGHGMEIGGRNYLLPVDARLESDSDVDDEAVPLQYVLDKIHNAHNLKLVILDACRENPFNATMKRQTASRTVMRGLAPYEPQIASELIFYAAKDGEQAQDGDVNGHSPFAHALIARLATPRIEINKLFRLVTSDVLQETGNKQQPFVYGSTPGDMDFYFRTE